MGRITLAQAQHACEATVGQTPCASPIDANDYIRVTPQLHLECGWFTKGEDENLAHSIFDFENFVGILKTGC